MTSTLLNLSGKLPPITEDIIREIANAAVRQGIPFFIVGAFARDLILQFAYNIQTHRATNDIDFGIRVERWEQLEGLISALIGSGNFRKDSRQKQRLIYKESVPVDIVPFGQIEDASGSISWPPDYEIEMSALGFNEAYTDSITVLVANDVEVAVSSLAGLCLMKLVSWKERRANKDVSDLALIMTKYLEAGNEAKVYEDGSPHTDLLDDDQFDYGLTSARLLGRDIKPLLTERAKRVVMEILDRETNTSGECILASIISGYQSLSGDLNKALEMLKKLKQGILDN